MCVQKERSFGIAALTITAVKHQKKGRGKETERHTAVVFPRFKKNNKQHQHQLTCYCRGCCGEKSVCACACGGACVCVCACGGDGGDASSCEVAMHFVTYYYCCCCFAAKTRTKMSLMPNQKRQLMLEVRVAAMGRRHCQQQRFVSSRGCGTGTQSAQSRHTAYSCPSCHCQQHCHREHGGGRSLWWWELQALQLVRQVLLRLVRGGRGQSFGTVQQHRVSQTGGGGTESRVCGNAVRTQTAVVCNAAPARTYRLLLRCIVQGRVCARMRLCGGDFLFIDVRKEMGCPRFFIYCSVVCVCFWLPLF